MAAKKFKLCRLVQENDGRFRVYWNTINLDGSTRNNKCRVKDRKEGLEKCRILEEELSQTGLVEETVIDPEDRIMIDRFYKTNPSISLAEFIRRYMGFVAHPKQSRTVMDLFREWKKHKLLTASNRETSASRSQESTSSRKYSERKSSAPSRRMK